MVLVYLSAGVVGKCYINYRILSIGIFSKLYSINCDFKPFIPYRIPN